MTKQTSKKRRTSRNAFPEPVEELLRQIAKQAAGKPLHEALKEGMPLAQLIGRIAEMGLDEELTEHLGFEPHHKQKQGRRPNSRNGYSQKTLTTEYGQVDIDVPRDRRGEFEPQLVGKYARASSELEARALSMYVGGMSTRDIQEHVRKLYHLDVSESFVSRLVERIEPELLAWRNRPLESLWAIVFVDAIHLKVRQPSGVESTALYTVAGYSESGQREVLGLYMAPPEQSVGESASFWHQVFIELQGRGVQDILILCADGLSGLPQAAELVWPRVRFQPCVVHMVRNSLRRMAWNHRKGLAVALRRIYQAPTYALACAALEELEAEFGKTAPAVVAQWRRELPRLENLWSYGPALRKLVYTTNPIEALHRKVRQAVKTRGSFPNANSALRLVTMVLKEMDEGKRPVRNDWRKILYELPIHFGERLPPDWGLLYVG